MARSFSTAFLQVARAMDREATRQQRAAAREYAAAHRRAEQARKADESAQKKAMQAAAVDRKSLEKEAKIAHVEAMEANVGELNSELAAKFDDVDSLLAATIDVDDYVDLEQLRRTNEFSSPTMRELEIPTRSPYVTPEPKKPVLKQPEPPKGFFGKKKKHEAAIQLAMNEYSKAYSAWETKVNVIRIQQKKDSDRFALDEQERITKLGLERALVARDSVEHNKRIDTLITNLGYGTQDAIQEYVSIVMSNSIYPKHFQVSHSFTFQPETAELTMKVVAPPPSAIPNIKLYKYKKITDEIITTSLPVRDLKNRYSGAIHQIGIRSFHEVFEADRRGIIKMISLEIGTEEANPATGIVSYIPFLAAAVEREAFIEFDLTAVIPTETLKYLGAAISKDPFNLVPVNLTGVRRS